MRFLVDENLSPELVLALSDAFPGSRHVRDGPGRGASDEEVWAFARDHGLLLLTRDKDFERLAVLRGPPPKVVWLTVGNCSTLAASSIVRAYAIDIARFAAHEEAAFLAIE